jgi:hypothetical protein
MLELFRKRKRIPERNLEEIKQICKIIFVDDRSFDVVEILGKAGWVNCKRIKDVQSLDEIDVRESNILFVDIQGVGKALKFKDEGLGLIGALKNKYPTKSIIVYSAESQGDRFHDGLSKADARLYKNADPIQFISLVEQFSKEAFSFEECMQRIQDELKKQLGTIMPVDDISKKIEKIINKQTYDPTFIAKVFNLENASSLASIIKLFVTGN